MTRPRSDRPNGSTSFWHKRRPGIRYVFSAAAIIGGVVLALRFAGGDDAWLVPVALGLVVLGLVSIPVYRWMDKRGL